MSGREYSHELGRRFVFAIANFLESVKRKDGTNVYQLISNTYERNLRQFCEIILPDRTINFDIVFRRYISQTEAALIYVECKYAESIHTIRTLNSKYEVFLENTYLCTGIKKYRESEFLFVTNTPFLSEKVSLSDNFAQLKKLLSKRLGTSIKDERITQILRNVHELILPQWFLEQIVI